MSDSGKDPGDELPDEGSSSDPFAGGMFFGLPFMGDLARMFQSQGGTDPGRQVAQQLAVAIATEGQPEPNVDPLARRRIDELVRVAELHVGELLDLPTTAVSVRCVNRSEWALATLDDHRALLDQLGSGALPFGAGEIPDDDPAAALLGPLLGLITPMMGGMTTGGLVGHLARRAFGSYELPLPRPGHELLVVPAAIDSFASDWSLDPEAVRLWVLIEQITLHLVLRTGPVSEHLDSLFAEYGAAARPDTQRLEERFSQIDPSALGDPAALQRFFGDPETLLGALRSPEQEAILPRIAAALGTVFGVADHLLDQAQQRLLGRAGQLAEAMRRRRVEASSADRFVEQLLGLELTEDTVRTGGEFVDGVVERAGIDGVRRLWEAPGRLPTPNELAAPGLWLARIDLPDT